MEIDPNAVIAALGQQVGALAADNARLRVGLDTAEAELTKVTRERDEAEQAYLDAEGELAKLHQDAEDELAKLRDEAVHQHLVATAEPTAYGAGEVI